MISIYKRAQGRVGRRIRAGLRRIGRRYVLICAHEDAVRLGFFVPDKLPHSTELLG